MVILFGALIYFKVPGAAAKALDARGIKIQAELDEALRLRQEAQALLADIKVQREAAEKVAAEMIANAEADSERLRAEAAVKLDEQIKRRQSRPPPPTSPRRSPSRSSRRAWRTSSPIR
jgi:F-type H+-transporting ATPase subunit b